MAKQINTKIVYIELSHTFIAYKIEDENNSETIQINCSIDDDFKTLLKYWYESINKLLEKFDFTAKIILLFKSENLMIKNINKDLSIEKAYEYFSNKLACTQYELEIKQIKNNSYLIAKNSFLKDILFQFKDYEIFAIYDISSLGSFKFEEKNSLYIDLSLNTFDIVLNQNILQKRSFTSNLSNLIRSCAKTLYTDDETSLQNLKTGYRDIKSYKQLEKSTKTVEIEIKNFIDLLAKDITTTLSFFSIYDNISKIDKIYINGDILEYDFLIHILSDKLHVTFIPVPSYININNTHKTNISLVGSLEKDILEANRLRLDGINYNDGKNEYIFIENRFVKKQNLNKKEKQKLNTIQKVRVENKKNIEENKQFSKSIFKMDMSELYEYLIYKIRFINSNNASSKFSGQNRNAFYAVLITLFFCVFAYFSYIYVSESESKFNLQVSSLEDRISRVDKLKNRLGVKNKTLLVQNDELNKIFWTQKIITIANLMPNEIWLSSINLENKTRQIEDKEVTSKILVLEARALPSSIGHIASIANYMQNLLSANDEFKKDFVDITFGGAEIINEYGYDVINFKLYCNFEKNINIKDIENEKNKTKDNSIGTNIQNINNYKQEQLNILEGIGK